MLNDMTTGEKMSFAARLSCTVCTGVWLWCQLVVLLEVGSSSFQHWYQVAHVVKGPQVAATSNTLAANKHAWNLAIESHRSTQFYHGSSSEVVYCVTRFNQGW